MITFVLLATLLTAVVMLLVLLPLRKRNAPTPGTAAAVNVGLYRDQLRELDEDLAAGTIDRERHAEARAELERRLLEDTDDGAVASASPAAPRGVRGTVLTLAVIVPVITVSLYLVTGTPEAVVKQAAAPEAGAPHAVTPQQVEQMISKLAARLKDTPGDAEGWLMLGRSYAALSRFKEAAPAYAKAVALIPDNAQILVDYADVLAMSLGRRLAGEPEKLVLRALEIDPNNLKALAMAGTIEFDNKNYAAAITHWQKMVTALPPDSEIAGSVRSSIAEARSLAGMKPETASSSTAPPVSAGRVSGTVRIADNLKARLAPDDIVFIFARAKDGPPAPLAVLRKRAADLPVKFVLDDSMAMAPGMNLSRFSTVIVGARISKSGSAGRQPGDIEGFSSPVRTGAADVDVIISTEVR